MSDQTELHFSTTEFSRSIFSRADVQKIKLPSDSGEFRQSRERAVTLRLLDYLVRAEQYVLRNVDSERLRGLEVDHQLELGRLLDGKIRGPGALQNLVDVLRRVVEGRGEVISIAEQPARDRVIAQRRRHRQSGGLKQFLQPRALAKVYGVRGNHDGLRSLSNHLLDGGAEL